MHKIMLLWYGFSHNQVECNSWLLLVWSVLSVESGTLSTKTSVRKKKKNHRLPRKSLGKEIEIESEVWGSERKPLLHHQNPNQFRSSQLWDHPFMSRKKLYLKLTLHLFKIKSRKTTSIIMRRQVWVWHSRRKIWTICKRLMKEIKLSLRSCRSSTTKSKSRCSLHCNNDSGELIRLSTRNKTWLISLKRFCKRKWLGYLLINMDWIKATQ